MVGVSHDGHTVYKVFKLLGLCHGLRAGRRHRPLGLPEKVCFPRQIGVELLFLLLGIALALKGQADLQGWDNTGALVRMVAGTPLTVAEKVSGPTIFSPPTVL